MLTISIDEDRWSTRLRSAIITTIELRSDTTEQHNCIINEHPVKYSNNCYTFIARSNSLKLNEAAANCSRNYQPRLLGKNSCFDLQKTFLTRTGKTDGHRN